MGEGVDKSLAHAEEYCINNSVKVKLVLWSQHF